MITDQNGAVTNRKDYTAFGEVNYTSQRVTTLGYDDSAEETRKGYTGYEKDSESGLDFAQARYYNAVHGRFTSVDPLTASASIRNPQTFNRCNRDTIAERVIWRWSWPSKRRRDVLMRTKV